MTSYGEFKTMKRNVLLLTPHKCLYLQKDVQQDVGHSSDLDQKRSGSLLTSTDHEENGNWWWSFSEKADTQFSEPRVQCPEERKKAKEVEKFSIHFCADGDTIETVFRTIISVNQFVSTEQSQICVRNTVLVKQAQGDLLWQDNLLSHCSSQQNYW